MFTILLLLVLGLVLLVKGADLLVDGAVMTARRLRISPLVIGLTIVAFGTSAPELVVNIIASLDPATNDIGLGNIIGSNISNIGLIIGLSALIFPLTIKESVIGKELPLVIVSSLVFLVLVIDRIFQQPANILSRGDGIILLLFFGMFLYSLFNDVRGERRSDAGKAEFEKEYHKTAGQLNPSWVKLISFLIIGIVGVMWGGQLVVENAAALARLIGISDILIGLTVIAVGTSLPELATSVAAALKKEPDIAVGNILGSNVFNTFLILGVNAVISPLQIQTAWFFDAIVMIVISILLMILAITGKFQISRKEGVILLALYIFYTTTIIIRG